MQCPKCEGKLVLTNSIQIDKSMLRLRRCTSCNEHFASKEILIDISLEAGEAIKKELYNESYMRQKMKAVVPAGNLKVIKPKERRQIATKPGKRRPGGLYFTYAQLFKKFRSKMGVMEDYIADYRPYPFEEYSIIVWFKDGIEKVYQYDPINDEFNPIIDAMKYEDILARKVR